MDFRHILVLVAVLLLGFWLAKKYPSMFASIPVLNGILA